MKLLIRFLLLCALTALATVSWGVDVAKWSARLEREDVRAGESARIVVTAQIDKGWHVYSIEPVAEGPKPTSVTLGENTAMEVAGAVTESTPIKEEDPNFGKVVGFFAEKAEFFLPVKVKAGATGEATVDVAVNFMACNESRCLPPKTVTVPLKVTVSPGEARAEHKGSPEAAASSETADRISKTQSEGLTSFMLFAFINGLVALLTPCVFPMIPVTVSFFSKHRSGEDGRKGIAAPLAYCLGIIVTFTLLGVVFGFSGVNRLATNVWVNLGLALLFIVLAASLFGVFELKLPSGLVNRASAKSRSGGIVGALFMGLTFTLTSFTCSVPFVGSILGGSVGGGTLYATLGMFAFSTAFALPFFFLALFPAALERLPRAGAWMVTVKAFMGFLELMAALKFLSNVDLSFSLGWITEPVFLATWAAIAALASLYLLGWVKLPHDTGEKIGWLRRGFGVAMAAAAVWFLAGINGANLGALAGFLPPDPYPHQEGASIAKQDDEGWNPTYEAALEQAKASGKNIFIDFTGVYCTNCRSIEKNVFSKREVKDLFGNFVLAKLFTDRGTPADDANRELQKKFTNTEALPIYVVVSPEGKVLKIHEQQVPIDDSKQFLDAISPFGKTAVAQR